MDKLFVAGFGESEFGTYLIIKDSIGKNPFVKVACTKVGTLNLVKGYTREDAKAFVGQEITSHKWGAPKEEQPEGSSVVFTELEEA